MTAHRNTPGCSIQSPNSASGSPVLRLRRLGRLPLHVFWLVSAAALHSRPSSKPSLRCGQRPAPCDPGDASVVDGAYQGVSRRPGEVANFPKGDFRPTALPKGEIRSTFRVARDTPRAARVMPRPLARGVLLFFKQGQASQGSDIATVSTVAHRFEENHSAAMKIG